MRSLQPGRVAVIGGGPAGAHCARRLGEGGVQVTLFEHRTRFEKPCGGGIPGRGLTRYPFLDDARLPARLLRQCTLIAPSGRECNITLAEPLYILRRGDLHERLLARARESGVTVRQERVTRSRATTQTPGAGRPAWTLDTIDADGRGETRGPFDFLVAADGAAGGTWRRLGVAHPPDRPSQGIGYYLPGLPEERVVLRFHAALRGYLWVFPRLDHASVGICAPLGDRPARELRSLVDSFLTERYGGGWRNGAVCYAALIPDAPVQSMAGRLQGDAWAVIGDAANTVDPLTREGIYYALVSADLLADALLSGRPDDYAVQWTDRIGREFSRAARHAGGFYGARFLERLVALCADSQAIRQVMSDLIAGRQPYVGLRRRLLRAAPAVAWDLVAGRLKPSHDS